jgi:colanic acid/amylovoran biosynthesis glycosyltransferase
MFVLASKTASDGNEEGIPNVIMEAMATGRLVIATRHAGIPELVRDGATGYLVPENAPYQLGATLLKAIQSQKEWPDLISKGRALVEAEHDVRKQIKKLESVIDELIQSPSKRKNNRQGARRTRRKR